MRLRTKLFLTWAGIMPLLWVPAFWTVERTVQGRFEEVARDRFEGTKRGLAGMQRERIERMRQAGRLVMSIPDLRALIAEQNYELSDENQASLRERLDNIEGLVGASFVAVLNHDGRWIAQSRQAPWATLRAANEFCAAPHHPAAALVRRVFARQLGGSNAMPGDDGAEYGVWSYGGHLYHVVAVPLTFQSDDGVAPAPPEGALVFGVAINDASAVQLGRGQNCRIAFVADDAVVASNVARAERREMLDVYRSRAASPHGAFRIGLDGTTYHGSIEPLADPQSADTVGRLLILCDVNDSEMQQQVLQNLLLIMVAGLLAGALASWLLSAAVTRPVRRLAAGVRRVADGELDLELPVRSRDELGELSGSFNDMVRKLRSRRDLERQVEEAQASNRAKGQFLANMSHEIRTPLNGVIGMNGLLLGTQLTDQQRKYAGLVKTSAELLAGLINDILDFSKIEAGKLDIERIELDLRTTVQEVMELLAEKAAKKGIEVGCCFDHGAPTLVRGDPGRLRQILVNLVNNALKFTEQGSVVVRVALEPAPAGGPTVVRFSVTDTGIGIPPDRVDRLFKLFSQVDASTTRKYGGTGLGLAISKQLAELMGGRIGVESVPGRGSTFWFTVTFAGLPEAHDKQPTSDVVSEQSAAQTETMRRRVLVAEDNQVNQVVTVELLIKAGYGCDVVDTGRKAVEAAMSGTYDAILMDCQMPEMDGFEATRVIRRREEEAGAGRHVPIIALTANAIKGDREECLAAGMDRYCSKPIDPRQLLATIESLCGRPTTPPPADVPPPAEGICAPTAALADLPPITVDTLLERCMNNAATAGVVLEKFERQAGRDVAAIERGLADRDAASVARTAHALKGAAGIVAADRLSAIAAELERLGRADRLDELESQLARLREEADKCLAYLPRARSLVSEKLSTEAGEPAEECHAYPDRG